MLSNAYFLAKFRFDTAENEPAKNLQNVAKKKANLPNRPCPGAPRRRRRRGTLLVRDGPALRGDAGGHREAQKDGRYVCSNPKLERIFLTSYLFSNISSFFLTSRKSFSENFKNIRCEVPRI